MLGTGPAISPDKSICLHRAPCGCDCSNLILQTVAPNIAKASGRTDPTAAVLGSLACLVDAPQGSAPSRPRRARMPEGDVVLQVDVATFTDQASEGGEGKGGEGGGGEGRHTTKQGIRPDVSLLERPSATPAAASRARSLK